MKIEEKFVEKFCETKFGRICYEEWGKGERVVIFFHGLLGKPIHGESLAKNLSNKNWRVLVPYLPGHGKSFDLPRKYNFSKLVTTMGEFVEKTAPQSAILAGHSLGGAISWEIACKRPDLVKKLILIDPGLKIAKKSLLKRGLIAAWNDLIIDRKAGMLAYPMVWNYKTMNLLSGLNVSNLLEDVPVLLLCGKDDKTTPTKDYEDKLKSLKNLKVQVFEGGHHWFQWQEEKYLKAVEDFL